MATDKPRFSVSFSVEEFEKIQIYKEEHGITTQSKAVAKLVELALDDMEKSGIINKSSSSTDENELKLLRMYRSINEKGKHKLLDYADDIIQSGKYKKAGSFRMDPKEA